MALGMNPASRPPATISHLLYLHGFRSSPQSAKARHVAGWMRQHRADVHWCCPQLPPSPQAAMELIHQLAAGWPDDRSAVIGSSLGGFYAAALAAERGWRTVLLNPAVDPARDLARYLGENTVWQQPQDRFYFQPAYIDELRAIATRTLASEAGRRQHGLPVHTLALICQGDEVLDWREMGTRHAHARQYVLPGNDHAISDFPVHWPILRAFLDL